MRDFEGALFDLLKQKLDRSIIVRTEAEEHLKKTDADGPNVRLRAVVFSKMISCVIIKVKLTP